MGGERILVIDDSKYMSAFLTDSALPSLGYQSLVASTGQRALELVSAEKPDAILLDLNLPDMDGLDVVRQLAKVKNQVPIILMTAYGSEQVAVEAFRLGVRDYLSKPIDLDEVANALERALHAPRLQRDRRQLAVDLRRTSMELRRQAGQVATLAGVGRTITASLDLDRILARVIEAAIQSCQAEEATVWLLEGTRESLVMVAETGIDQTDNPLPRLTQVKVQDALAGEAVRTRQPIRAADLEEGIKFKTGYLVKAVMYVPLLIQDRCLGVVSVANRDSQRAFQKSDLANLQALADYAAIAIENARLYHATNDSLQERLAELAAIREISEAVATLDLDILLHRAMSLIHKTLNVTCSNLDAGRVTVRRVPFGRGLIGSCAKDGTSYFTNDPSSHALYVPEIDQAAGSETHSLLVMPLTIKDRVIGVIGLVNKRAAPFDEQDVALLRAMGTPIGAAVDGSRLFDQITRDRATLRAVLDGSPNPILIVNHSGETLSCNPAARELFSISAGPVGEPRLEDVTGVPRLGELVAQGRVVTEEIALAESTFLTSTAPIVGVGSVIVMQDITYLKELDKAKSEFVTTVSHDLRSPLASIIGFTELLSEVGPLSERQQEFVDLTTEAAKNMKRMIDDLLDLARIEAGLSLAPDRCDLAAIAQAVVAGLQGLAARNDIELFLIQRGKIPKVVGVADQLRRAVENLVGNALKYTPPGGRVRVGLQEADRTLYLVVTDTGRGIPESALPYVFDRFYRVDEDRETAGSGLGLAIAKSIAEAHGGTISVRSQRGKGSVFAIALPLE
jgi:signal transduction histidine kinase/DNA-binding response OmpR family regulator